MRIFNCLLLFLILFMAIVTTGCKKVSSDEVVSDVLNAYAKVKTYSVDEKSTAITEVVGGDRPGTKVTSDNITGIVNIEKRQFEKSIFQNGAPRDGMQTYIRHYLFKEWLYIKGDILNYNDPDHEIWVKLDLDDEQLNRDDRMWENGNQLGQQVELLSTASEVLIASSDRVNDIAAFVLEIKPDWQVLSDWLAGQPPWSGPRFLDLPELAQSLSFKLWVGKETGLILKSEIRIKYKQVVFASSDVTVDFKGEMSFFDYDEPFEVELPEDAKHAVRGPIS